MASHLSRASVICVEGLRKEFRAKQKQPGLAGSLRAFVRPTYRVSTAVRDIEFSVNAGDLVAFIGPNGAGKSTTIKMLTGILHPSGGNARVLGLTPWRDRQTLAFNIASVFGQRSQLWQHLPPLDTFNLLARIYEIDPVEYRARVRSLIDLFELGPLMQTPARKLSLGERMRCEIAAALLHRPAVVFLDEPTIGLDVVAKVRIRELLRRMNREEGTTIFLTSHDTGDIEQVCERVMVVNHGALVLDTSIVELKRSYLRTKVIDLKLHGASDDLHLPGVTVLSRSEYGVRVSVNTDEHGIDAVVGRLLAHYSVHDITIEDPPMEEIITRIYAEGRRK
ncbi:MAG: ATP-binding cassette domain-containing protein [Capsulimonadaceae bacterium]